MSDWRSGPSVSDGAEETRAEAVGEDPAEDTARELSPWDAADSLLGREPDEQEIAQRQAEAAWNALEDGSAVNQVAEAQAQYKGTIERLKESSPGIDRPECIEAMAPIVQQIAALYRETALGWNPELLRMAYEAVGGAERWAPDPDEERWMKVIPQQHERDAFSR